MSILRSLPRSTSLWCGLVLTLFVVACALISLWWTPYDPIHAVPSEALLGPSWSHLCGTDRYGRDIFSQLMVGAQTALLVALIAVLVGAGIGVPLGIVATCEESSPARSRRILAQCIARLVDLLLAFPALLLAIVSVAVFGAHTFSAALAIGIAGIPAFARVSRAGTLRVLSQAYIDAALIVRRSRRSIAYVHILPNISSLLLVQAAISAGLAILAEAGLSFLGLGTPAPEPSWGRMLSSAQAFLYIDPLLIVWPGLMISLTILGFNLLGQGIRDINDPHGRTH